jgi:hypothetical protein
MYASAVIVVLNYSAGSAQARKKRCTSPGQNVDQGAEVCRHAPLRRSTNANKQTGRSRHGRYRKAVAAAASQPFLYEIPQALRHAAGGVSGEYMHSI